MTTVKILFAVIIFSTLNAFAGGAVGNGGGFAYCSHNQRLFAYDYLLTLNHSFGRDIPAADMNKSIQYIASHLQRLNDPLIKEFLEFFSIIYTQTAGKKFLWFQQKNLRLMLELDLEKLLPSQCRARKQAAYFFAPFAGVPYSSYKYDPDLLASVQAQLQGPLQVSYLWVHEWLWNYFSQDNFLALAQFNRLLHSEKLATINAIEYNRLRAQLFTK